MDKIKNKTLIGPFSQILTMEGMANKGPLSDDNLPIILNGGILMEGDKISVIGNFDAMKAKIKDNTTIHLLKGSHVALPGLVDAHTHICFGGNRARDYALRNGGSSYLEIAAAGGGIWDTVTQTRASSKSDLVLGILKRAKDLLSQGITTIEVKSGYGLSVVEEIKMLEAIQEANLSTIPELIPTCLAAHIIPKEHKSNPELYVEIITKELFPEIKRRRLANRVDAFVEQEAYTDKLIRPYFEKAKELGFDITLHADQFTPGGSSLAIEFEAISVDHLEVSTDKEVALLSKSEVIPTALPGATLGLGCTFTPARKLLDAGCSLAIASDYNPGSAPMGDLVTQASILGTFQKLTNAEILAGITYRAANALGRKDLGTLTVDRVANITIYPTDNYQNILYRQGQLKPEIVISKGNILTKTNFS